jgi:hypothetical protein
MNAREYVRVAELIADTVKAQNTDLLAADITILRTSSSLRVAIVGTAVKVKAVPSSGTAFYLNGGSALTLDALYVEEVPVDDGRTWNIQTDDAAGITVKHLAVDLIQDPTTF